ncbi:MAG: 2-hydroxyacid dehydrogenase [Bryobacteraceae bacterium]
MRVILLGRMAAGRLKELEERVPDAVFTAIPDPRRIDEHVGVLGEADAIVGWPLTNDLVNRAPNVRLVQASGIGIDGLDPEMLPPGVMVANTFHHEAAIGEWVVMAMLWLSRRPDVYDAAMRRGSWNGSCIWGEPAVVREIRGSTALLIGLGNIATETAARAAAFGVRLIGVSRRPTPREHYAEVIGWEGWRERLAEADFVIPACPLTPETTGLIGAAEIARMRRGAGVINVTRGAVVDEHALYEALRDRRIAGAAIDTWYRYPAEPEEWAPPSQFPFHELDNVLMSPHISGWTAATINERVEDIATNLRRLAAGEAPINRLR